MTGAPLALPAATNVAVFKFQMKSDTPDWRWLEKGLADRIATDFVRAPGLAVVARDEMQLVAQKMNWVPEMATTDAARMKEIQKQLKIEQLISGVYAVAEGRIRITGQIVDVESRQELARKEVEGPLEEVLDLQRQLSAELLAWFMKKEPAKILETLPVWTRSLPAMRALYEGMDLYDQGRYGEGWLKFRQASRDDPAYVEAVYWVGKMYYFMDRYEHARRSLERFVYLDNVHPRISDAIVEFCHTYEARGDGDPQTLLDLYGDLRYRFAHVKIRDGPRWNYPPRCDDWLRCKSGLLLEHLRRYAEAAIRTSPEGSPLDAMFEMPPICIRSAILHNALTGNTLQHKVVYGSNPVVSSSLGQYFYFKEGSNEEWRQERRMLSDDVTLYAPPGHVFDSLTVYALGEEEAGTVEVRLYWAIPNAFLDINRPLVEAQAPLAEAKRTGIHIDKAPRTGILAASIEPPLFSPEGRTPGAAKGYRIVPTFRKVEPCGALDVSCQNASRMRVEVDGVLAAWEEGIIGPLAAGEHVLRLSALTKDSPYDEWTARVTVEAGKAVPVDGRLPWKKDSPWNAWKVLRVPGDYPGLDLRIWPNYGGPAMLAEEEAIRLVWAHGGDLWSSVSTDGESLSPPRKLDLPVSSAWLEQQPVLLRDERGRFVLVFVSERDARHKRQAYVSWSRDFVQWSAPALMREESVQNCHDLIQDDRGQFVWAVSEPGGNVRIYLSRDGLRWEPTARVRMPLPAVVSAENLKLVREPDGRTGLYMRAWPSEANPPAPLRVGRFTSGDGVAWSGPEILAEVLPEKGSESPSIDLVVWKGRPQLLYHKKAVGTQPPRAFLSAPGPDGKWCVGDTVIGLPIYWPAVAYHPRWGYIMASTEEEMVEFVFRPRKFLPYLLRGPDLDAFLRPAGGQPGAAPAAAGSSSEGQGKGIKP
jgi:TolB-like protein